MDFLSLSQTAHALHTKEISSVELTQHYLNKIADNKELNAFISLDSTQALIDAQHADQNIKKRQIKPLTGIPMGIKDLFCTTNMLTTCGSRMLANFQAPYEATSVTRLKNAGAVLLGKNNMDEFAMGSSNEHSYFGHVKNPWNKEYVPGGSSGGSAAAVAAGLIPFSIGSDTGGSIRQPAAFCGISGIKPTYGLASRYGMVAYASSLDQAGPMARSAADLALILNAMLGFDPLDSTSSQEEIPDYVSALNQAPLPLKIGLPSCFFHPDVDIT
ncbi:MAG: amidase, partial [Legionella sp.]|nr:amidase [Legionella sp.]